MKKLSVLAILICFASLVGTGPCLAQAQGLLNQILTGQEGIQQAHTALQRLINQTVIDQNGRNVGQVQNILIGPSGGINYLIIARGYQLGRGGQLIPIPWSVANPTYQNGQVQIRLSRRELRNAPRFSAGQWPNFASRHVANSVHSYFGGGYRGGDLNQGYNPGDLNR